MFPCLLLCTCGTERPGERHGCMQRAHPVRAIVNRVRRPRQCRARKREWGRMACAESTACRPCGPPGNYFGGPQQRAARVCQAASSGRIRRAAADRRADQLGAAAERWDMLPATVGERSGAPAVYEAGEATSTSSHAWEGRPMARSTMVGSRPEGSALSPFHITAMPMSCSGSIAIMPR